MATAIGIVFLCLAAIGVLTREPSAAPSYRMTARRRRQLMAERYDLNPALRRAKAL